MAEINTVIAEASQDLQTIEDFVNLPADSDVFPRLLPSVNVGTLAGTRDAIFRAGGLPAEPFETLANMEADGASSADGQLAIVYNETTNNGLYVKAAGAWVKSGYDPLTQAKEHTDKGLGLRTANALAPITATRSNTVSGYPPELETAGLQDVVSLGGYVFDTVNNAIYCPRNMPVMDGNGNRLLTYMQKLDWGVTDFNANYTMLLYLDRTTRYHVLKSYTDALTETEKLNYILCAVVLRDSLTINVTTNAPYAIDYSRYGIASAYRRLQVYAAGNNSRALINYNTDTHVLSIPNDTILRFDDMMHICPAYEIECKNLSELSSVVSVFFDLATKSFAVRKYNSKLTLSEKYRFALLASVRDIGITSSIPNGADWRKRVGLGIDGEFTINDIDAFENGGGNGGSPSNKSINVQDEPMVRACAHRGFNGEYLAPENTLPAFKLAADYGFWGAETDLRLTSDGHWVLMHDATIDKTTTGTGAVADLTLAQIRSFDANHGKSEYVGVKVPTLEEYLTTCKRHNIVPYMQTYVAPDEVSIIPLAKAIREIIGEENAVIISTYTSHLSTVRAEMPNIGVELLTSSITDAKINEAKAIGNCSLGVSSVGVNKADIQKAAKEGVRVSMWAENIEPEKYIDMNVLRVTSDYAIPPDFDKGFQKLFIKNKADWSNFSKSSGFTGAAQDGILTINANDYVTINIGAHPLGVLIVEFYATSTSADSELLVYAGKSIKIGAVDTLSPTHKFSCLIRNDAEVDTTVTFKANTGVMKLSDVKIKVYEV